MARRGLVLLLYAKKIKAVEGLQNKDETDPLPEGAGRRPDIFGYMKREIDFEKIPQSCF